MHNRTRNTLFLCAILGFASSHRVAAAWETLSGASHAADAFTDGDSVPINTGTESYIINLYFIDAPETNDRYTDKIEEQAAYWGRTVPETIQAGKAAGEFVTKALANKFVIETRKERIAGNTDRFYGMIKIGDRYLSELLVEAGLARVKGKSRDLADGTTAAVFLDKLRALETAALEAKRGAWSEGEIDPTVNIAPTTAPPPSGVITLTNGAIAYTEDGAFKPMGKLKPGQKVKIVDENPYVRVLIAVPGKPPIPALIKQQQLK